jgi:hypothetical protein
MLIMVAVIVVPWLTTYAPKVRAFCSVGKKN